MQIEIEIQIQIQRKQSYLTNIVVERRFHISYVAQDGRHTGRGKGGKMVLYLSDVFKCELRKRSLDGVGTDLNGRTAASHRFEKG